MTKDNLIKAKLTESDLEMYLIFAIATLVDLGFTKEKIRLSLAMCEKDYQIFMKNSLLDILE